MVTTVIVGEEREVELSNESSKEPGEAEMRDSNDNNISSEDSGAFNSNLDGITWLVARRPIEIKSGKVHVRPYNMEIGKVYRFVWGGEEVFAIRRSLSDRVDFYVSSPEEVEA
jgi:hypothetical protein